MRGGSSAFSRQLLVQSFLLPIILATKVDRVRHVPTNLLPVRSRTHCPALLCPALPFARQTVSKNVRPDQKQRGQGTAVPANTAVLCSRLRQQQQQQPEPSRLYLPVVLISVSSFTQRGRPHCSCGLFRGCTAFSIQTTMPRESPATTRQVTQVFKLPPPSLSPVPAPPPSHPPQQQANT